MIKFYEVNYYEKHNNGFDVYFNKIGTITINPYQIGMIREVYLTKSFVDIYCSNEWYTVSKSDLKKFIEIA